LAPANVRCPGIEANCSCEPARHLVFGLIPALAVAILPSLAPTAAVALPLRAKVEIAGAVRSIAADACGEPDVSLSPEAGGLTRISVASLCRAGEIVSVTYAEATLVERLDASGHAKITLDCFAGEAAPVAIAFEDGTSVTREPVTDDLQRYSKVAILWSSSVDLDLHAFEYAAAATDPGHVWSGAPSSFAEAEARARQEKRGHGFLSTAGAGRAIGMNVEVYTFVHFPRERAAGVKMGVDFMSRGARAEGEYCGTGRYAELQFKAYVLERGRVARALDLAFASLPCGTDISDAARINSRLIPELTVRE
jgi:hypothetical protein